jgi:replicative DNA helicase
VSYTPKGRTPIIRVELNDAQRRVMHGLCGSVLDYPNAMKEMGKYQVNPNALPFDMKLENTFWRQFYRLSRERQPIDTGKQNGEVVITRAEMEAAMVMEHPADQVKAFLDKAQSMVPIDSRGPWGLARILVDWFQNRRAEAAVKDMLDIFNDVIGNTDDKFERANAVWAEAQPREQTVKVMPGDELPDFWLEVYQKRLERANAGILQGPVPHYLDDHLPPMREGELGVLAAKSRFGKTTILLDWAHDFAHEQGFDVLFVYMETLTESMFDRWVSRHVWVTVMDLVDPRRGFNLLGDKPNEKAAHAKFLAMAEDYKAKQKGKGRTFFAYAPGITPAEFETLVAQHKAMANVAERGLVVIVDYYSLLAVDGLPVSRNAEEWRMNDARAAFFKDCAKQYGVFMWVAAQDNMAAKYDNNERKTSKNGSVIFEQSQYFVRIMRDYAKEDLPMAGPDGKQMNDHAGRPVFWHKKEQPSAHGHLVVEKASDGATGLVPFRFNPAYYRVQRNDGTDGKEGAAA